MQIPCKCATIFMNIWNSYIWTSYQELNPFTSFFVTSHAITKSPFGQRLAAKLFAKLRRTAVSPVHLPFWPVVSQYLRLRFRWFSLAGPKRLIKKKRSSSVQFVALISAHNSGSCYDFLLRVLTLTWLPFEFLFFWKMKKGACNRACILKYGRLYGSVINTGTQYLLALGSKWWVFLELSTIDCTTLLTIWKCAFFKNYDFRICFLKMKILKSLLSV